MSERKKLEAKSSSKMLGLGISRDPFDPLLPIIQSFSFHHPLSDLSSIRRAFATAREKHEGQFRISGEPYITHPLAVAQILADLGADEEMVMAGLLHDTVEDTSYSISECQMDFGKVAFLVEAVTKISSAHGDLSDAETIRKLILAMGEDARVLVVKLADRLHNARTWHYMPPQKAAKKAKETLDIYVPLADRIGMESIRLELEELSFKYLHPQIYSRIVEMVKARSGERDRYMEDMKAELKAVLKAAGIKASVTGRLKSYFSIYRKIAILKKDIDQIFDLVGLRVIVETVQDCYKVLGLIHEKWLPIPGRFKDYIAMPKPSKYQALHTTILGNGGKEMEVQIRTLQMHYKDEYGMAAHWKYKELVSAAIPEWTARVAHWARDVQDASEFLSSLQKDLNSKDLYTFTPKGEVIFLPEGSCPLDFAYAVHTEVGNRAVGSKINGVLSPLSEKLKMGDRVEIMTSPDPNFSPSYDWLSFVVTPKAKTKIKKFLSKDKNSEVLKRGKGELFQYLIGKGDSLAYSSLLFAAKRLGFESLNSLYFAIGKGEASCQKILDEAKGAKMGSEMCKSEDYCLSVQGARGEKIALAKCCKPIPGDAIAGFVTNSRGVHIHRLECGNFLSMKEAAPSKVADAEWNAFEGMYGVEIEVLALDRRYLLSDLSSTLSKFCVNLIASRQALEGNMVFSRFSFKIRNRNHLSQLEKTLEEVEGVIEVRRIGD